MFQSKKTVILNSADATFSSIMAQINYYGTVPIDKKNEMLTKIRDMLNPGAIHDFFEAYSRVHSDPHTHQPPCHLLFHDAGIFTLYYLLQGGSTRILCDYLGHSKDNVSTTILYVVEKVTNKLFK